MAAVVANTGTAHKSLYAALELEEGASPQEVKAAYDKMQAQLKQVPGSGSQEKAKLFSHAYVVLVDPKKRAVYDEYGDKAWDLLNNPYTDAMFQSMESHNLIKAALYFLVVLTLVLFVQTVLIALRVEGTMGGDWGWVLFPIWFFDGLLGITLIFLFYNSVKAWNFRTYELEGLTEAQIRTTRTDQIVMQLYFWTYIIATAAIGWGMDHPDRAYWGVYLSICIAAEAMGLIASLPKCHPEVIRSKLDALSGQYTKDIIVVVMVILAAVSACWRLPFWFMLGLNLSFVKAGISYYVVAIPILCGMLATWEYLYLYTKQKSTTKMQAMLGLVPMVFVQFLFLVTVFLVCGKLEGAGRSVGDALVPLFLLELILVASAIGLVIAFKMYDKEMKMASKVKDMAKPTEGGVAGAIEAASAIHGARGGAGPPKAPPEPVHLA